MIVTRTHIALLAAASVGAASAQTQSISVSIGDLSGPGFEARGLRLELAGDSLTRATLRIGELAALDHRWHDLAVRCNAFRLERSTVACDAGRIEQPVTLPVAFCYDLDAAAGSVTLSPAPGERWHAVLEPLPAGGSARTITLTLAGAQLARVQAVAPALPITLGAGAVDGVVRATRAASGRTEMRGELTVRNAAFSDASGLHAGDALAGRVAFNGAHAGAPGSAWRWDIDATWSEGEVFWDPVYTKAGYRLVAAGTYGGRTFEVGEATLAMQDIGEVRASASVDLATRAIVRARIETAELPVPPLYARFLKPLAANSALGELRTDGRLRASATVQAGRVTEATLDVDDLSVEDERQRFALFGVYAHAPWKEGARTEGRIGMSGAEVQRLPLGAVGATLDIGSEDVRADDFNIPVLSGLLQLRDLRVRRTDEGLAWQVSGALSPVPLPELLAHFGLPAMQGTIAGEIPRVRYERSTLTVDGALTIRVFDGTVTVTGLQLESPLGLAPRLRADLDARGLDLDLVTRTFAFGRMTGKIDAHIADLVLSDWRPVRFDARVASSPGDYPKRISQTAVNSITALGGGGAAQAIQETALRFFETFGYSKLGITCRLENGVCRMGGIEDRLGGYVLVAGGGVPAINVLGYNRDVGWEELVTRLKRVLDANVKATIQ
ncbi:MAG: hypothetical protein IT515_14840 [Burkholderiales bacterium]|nr:hypothetical protein [Burkholderiales bacterium]